MSGGGNIKSKFQDGRFTIFDNGDQTKKLVFEVDEISTATTRTITMPDEDVDLGDMGTVTSVTGTASRISSTGGATPVIDIDAAYVGQSSITTLGTVTTGVWTGTTVAIANGGTGSTSFTSGSVLFSDGSTLAQDNSNFFWDDTNNRLGIGTNTPTDNLVVVGNVDIIHTSTESDDHAFEIECDAAGFIDVKAIEINYVTGALAATGEDAIISINVDETGASGGELFGLEILSTAESSVVKAGLKVGTGVGAIAQSSGTFGDADSILNKLVDVTAALADGGGGGISCFVADNDTVTIADAAKFEEVEVILSTEAGGAGIAPSFEISTGESTWQSLGPIDGTNGCRNTGNIAWQLADVTAWATSGGLYKFRWTRTRNNLNTTPIFTEIQIAADVEFLWDKNGDVNVNSLVLSTDLAVPSGGTGASTLTGVLTGNGTSAFTASAVTDNTLIRGSTSNLVQDSTITVTDAGEMVNASQPAFLGTTTAAAQSNVSGDGTGYTVLFATEVFDQNSDFASSTFTAPVAGRYNFTTGFVYIIDISGTPGGNEVQIQGITSNRNYSLFMLPTSNKLASFSGANNWNNFSTGFYADMDALDTCIIRFSSFNGSKVDDINPGASLDGGFFSGSLIC